MNEAIHYVMEGPVAVVTLDNPPVNALAHSRRKQLFEAIDAAESDSHVKAIVLIGAGRGFSAGADAREFGQPRLPPSLPDICDRVDRAKKPIVAALHGMALGGGLELALAAHYRIAARGTKLGLPEVLLGLMPGAGGTQRLPRIMGVARALELMLSGRHLPADQAVGTGLVDALVEGDLRDAAVQFAINLITSGAGPRHSSEARISDVQGARAAIANARVEIERKSRGLFSPIKIIEATEAALDRSLADGLKIERKLFLECLDTPQRRGLVHAFFAERAVGKLPAIADVPPRQIHSAGVVGGGTMGAGIAVSLLDAGLPVVMVERDDESLARGRANVERIYDGLVAKGRMTPADKCSVMERLIGTTSYVALTDADLVIEAVFEDMALKQEIFARLDQHCKRGAVLATNTSYLDIDAIADCTSRPADVLGLHFFSPANIMKLLEIVVPGKVAPDAVATGLELARRLGKTAVRAGVCDGFIGNRILAVYRTATEYLMEDGASPYQIDEAVREFGYPMGPFQVNDLSGLDISWATRKRRAPLRDPRARYVEIADRLCERGWFGQKSGRGWYLYPGGKRAGEQDPEVLAIIDMERARAGVKPRSFTNEEIMRRYIAAMVNEGAKLLADGIALRPLDIDVVFLCGYGFPRYRGGPMHYADAVGLPQILKDINEFSNEDSLFWEPAPLLEELVGRGANFQSLNQ